jgi:hypothetical protein
MTEPDAVPRPTVFAALDEAPAPMQAMLLGALALVAASPPQIQAVRAVARDAIAPRPGQRLLDAGCGVGEAARDLLHHQGTGRTLRRRALRAGLTGVAATPVPVAEAAPLSAPVTGSFTDAAGGQGTFAGTFTPTEFVYDGTDVLATGTLTGTMTDSAGTALGSVSRTVSLPIDPAASGGSAASGASALAVCEILNLTLRPLDLNLLGLTVHLDTVHLVIAAVSGSGELLGNLLCAVVGLLDDAQIGQLLADLLNQILAIIDGLG